MITALPATRLPEKHLQEWRNSGVDDGITCLNVEAVSGDLAIELVAGEALERVGSHGKQYVTRETGRILTRYAHLKDGGWLVTGLNPLNNWERLEFGQFKPDIPRIDTDGKLIKYELQPKTEARLVLLDVPDHIADRIYEKHGVTPSSEDRARGFWHCVWLYNLPIAICEGAKKAGCMLTAGYAAVALPGIWMGIRKHPDPHLHPDLAYFAQPGRTFIFAFDQDEKPKTRDAVAAAEWCTGKLLRAKGCIVLSAQWEPSLGKGIDDVAANAGLEKVNAIIDSAEPLNRARGGEGFDPDSNQYFAKKRKWRFQQYWNLLKQDFSLLNGRLAAITEEYEGHAPNLDLKLQNILLQGWLGAGKTEAAIRSLAEIAKQKQVIWVTSRNGLLRQTAERFKAFGVDIRHYQDDVALNRQLLWTNQPGVYMMAPDSFKEYAVSHVKWDRVVLVFDEFNGIRSEVTSKIKEFPQIERAVRECRQFIAIDAFLSDADVLIISKYREIQEGNTRIYRQRFQKSTKPIIWLETTTKQGDLALSHEGVYLPLLKQWVDEKVGKIAVAVDSKSCAKSLKLCLEGLGRKVLLISGDTPDESQLFMLSPDEYWERSEYDVLIYTPTAQSGLDVQSHFDRGLLISVGVLPPIQMLQMLGRCRQCKEWYVSAPRRSINSDTAVSKISAKKVKEWAERISTTMDRFGMAHSPTATVWEVWQETTRDIEKAFNSEYLRALLDHFFENVTEEVIEDPDVSGYRHAVAQVKYQDTVSILNANAEKGRELIGKEQAAATDADVWNVELARIQEKYPLTEFFVEQYREAEGSEAEEILGVFQLFRNNRLERLKHWVQAMNPDDPVVDEMREALESKFVSSNSALFKSYRNIRLFRELNLQQLAVCRRDTEAVVGETHFNTTSPLVSNLWDIFVNSEVSDLYPTVETIGDFWAIVCRCMSSMGYQRAAKKIRVEAEGLHRNGSYRSGEARYSKSKVMHFSAWLIMEESGSEKFREMFPVIIESIRERIQRERDKRNDHKQSNFSPGGMAA